MSDDSKAIIHCQRPHADDPQDVPERIGKGVTAGIRRGVAWGKRLKAVKEAWTIYKFIKDAVVALWNWLF